MRQIGCCRSLLSCVCSKLHSTSCVAFSGFSFNAYRQCSNGRRFLVMAAAHYAGRRPFCFTAVVTPPPVGGRGIVFVQFLSLFQCQQDKEKTAGPICMKFSGRCGVTMGGPDYILGQFG